VHVIEIENPGDARIEVFRNLKDRELAARGELFIAEGLHVVQRLLVSDVQTVSLLVTAEKLDDVRTLAPEDAVVYVGSKAVLDAVIGFEFHRHVLACGRRPASPSLASLIKAGGPTTLLVCPEIANHENLGSLMRTAAALGVDGLVLGERSCDPYWRRSVRVSMGAVFSLPIVRSDDIKTDMRALRDRHGVALLAAVTDADAVDARSLQRAARTALVVGPEDVGLHRHFIELCDQRVTLPMSGGTDSLNVTVAAGILLWALRSEA